MDKLSAMNAFTKVVASASYAEAARRLGITRSAVSKAVSELEADLGARLLDRTTRRVAPTEAGLAYYQRCLAILAEVDEAEAQIARLHDEPKGCLRVNAPMSFGTRCLSGVLADFMARYPDLKIELALSDRTIDPLEEGFDVTIRIGRLGDSSLIARRLGTTRMVLVASPDYLTSHGRPEAPVDLARHRCLHYGHATAMQKWQLSENGKDISVPIDAAMSSNNGDTLRDAALRGNGIARLPTFIVGEDIDAGRLDVVLEAWSPADLDIHALYAPNRYLAAKTRLFIDVLVERFAGMRL
ncbi:LysR family transcriptional regulator [Hyphomicrobium sp.]|uniref:LysR family transcriptional regulator n=1 Tax=Hyphomicrobium sp. TaxID=82 RepID=UPI002BEE8265|nr:LysR family transcriptional regulator [Hyphomicrobium sp.]HRN88666.1 LysR family transcriptional regulator [Hyphomicrobium sp.]HRQ25632.1 LysR family transcriptional regulator [Hyphomicrobium sp.]